MFSKLLSALNYICKNTNQQYLVPKFYEIDYRTYAKYYFGCYEIKHHYLLDLYSSSFIQFLNYKSHKKNNIFSKFITKNVEFPTGLIFCIRLDSNFQGD